MAPLIAEDLLLLMLDDEKGTLAASGYMKPVLGGAVLAVGAALAGAVEVEDKPSHWKGAVVHTIPDARPEDPVLASAYDVVAEKPRTAQDLVEKIGKNLKKELLGRLVESGILEHREAKMVGLIPRDRWPTADLHREQKVRRDLNRALVQGLQPDERTAALIAILVAMGRAHRVIDHQGLSSSVVKKRAKEISEGAWAAKAIRDALNAATAAIGAGAVAGAIAAAARHAAGERRQPLVRPGVRVGRLLGPEHRTAVVSGQVGLHERQPLLGDLRVEPVDREADRGGDVPGVDGELRGLPLGGHRGVAGVLVPGVDQVVAGAAGTRPSSPRRAAPPPTSPAPRRASW